MTESNGVDFRRITNITMTDDGCLFAFESITDASRLKPGEIVVRIEVSYRDTGSAPKTRDDMVAVWTICIAQTDTRLRVVYECPPFPVSEKLSPDFVSRLASWVAASLYPKNFPFTEAISSRPERRR
ncbi:hypothetical protein ACFZBU_42255 [Embleya sp. NPDC008237]|uniref:hypothetical protein n=1 Tax=Embleya sp. NPDC008237 TaxID=3363978 RepID=UPI0036EE3B9E